MVSKNIGAFSKCYAVPSVRMWNMGSFGLSVFFTLVLLSIPGGINSGLSSFTSQFSIAGLMPTHSLFVVLFCKYSYLAVIK